MGDECAGVYELQGLNVRCEFPLHSAPPSVAGVVDVDVRWGPQGEVPTSVPPGELVAALVIEGTRFYSGVRQGDRVVFRAHGLCDFVIGADLRTVECRPDPACDREFVSVLMTGTVVAFLLGMAGRPVLHGSAVEVDGRALAFVGYSGGGKSTTAALLCADGARLVSDDLLHLDLDLEGEDVACVGRSCELRLRPSALAVLDGFAQPPPSRTTVDGKVAVRLPPAPTSALPLAHLVVPSPSRTATDLEVERVRGPEALLTLSRYPRILGWQGDGWLRAQFDLAARLAERVPLWRAVIPWGPPFSPTTARELLDHLEGDG